MPAKRTTSTCKQCGKTLSRELFRAVRRPDSNGTRPDIYCIECREAFDIERSKIHRVNTTVFCGCGCGRLTNIATKDWPEHGHVKGEPLAFVIGHNMRTAPYPESPYTVDPNTGCWEWRLGLDRDGYGRLWKDGRTHRAHRVYFEDRFGPLPEGHVPDHCCPQGPNRSCVNPDHMRPMTMEDNSRFKSTTKLSYEIAAEIRALAMTMTQREIGERFGISQSHVYRIIKGIRW